MEIVSAFALADQTRKKYSIENITTDKITTENISTQNTLNNTPESNQDNREKIIELLYDIQKKQNIIINIFNNIK